MRISTKMVLGGILTASLLALCCPVTTSAAINCDTFTVSTATAAEKTAAAAACPCRTDIPGNRTLAQGAKCSQGNGQKDTLFGDGGIFKQITSTVLFLIGAASVVMLIYGAVRYTISGGDAAAVKNAKNTIMYAIIGIIVAVLAYAAVDFVIKSLA